MRLVLLTQTPSLSEIMRSCNCFPHVSKVPTKCGHVTVFHMWVKCQPSHITRRTATQKGTKAKLLFSFDMINLKIIHENHNEVYYIITSFLNKIIIYFIDFTRLNIITCDICVCLIKIYFDMNTFPIFYNYTPRFKSDQISRT